MLLHRNFMSTVHINLRRHFYKYMHDLYHIDGVKKMTGMIFFITDAYTILAYKLSKPFP